jgi:cell division protein FtsQ
VSAPQHSVEEVVRTIVVDKTPPRRGWFKRRANRRITVQTPSLGAWMAEVFRALGRKLVVLAKAAAVVAFVAASVFAVRAVMRHVVESPRFAVRDVRVTFAVDGDKQGKQDKQDQQDRQDRQATPHVTADEVRELAGVDIGDKLLAVDADAVAKLLASHPWIASARVRRELPSVLAVEITERHAVASALLGALYLLDADGRPFKRATFEEADGLPVITGVTREQYAALRHASEAVFREAIGLVGAYGTDPARPKLSEVHVDARSGFSLVLMDGGGQIRLGRGEVDGKLARMDRIIAALGPRGAAGVATVYLDGPAADRVTVRLRQVRD